MPKLGDIKVSEHLIHHAFKFDFAQLSQYCQGCRHFMLCNNSRSNACSKMLCAWETFKFKLVNNCGYFSPRGGQLPVFVSGSFIQHVKLLTSAILSSASHFDCVAVSFKEKIPKLTLSHGQMGSVNLQVAHDLLLYEELQ